MVFSLEEVINFPHFGDTTPCFRSLTLGHWLTYSSSTLTALPWNQLPHLYILFLLFMDSALELLSQATNLVDGMLECAVQVISPFQAALIEPPQPIHILSGDLKVSVKEVNAKDESRQVLLQRSDTGRTE